MTYHQPQVIQVSSAVNAIQGDLGKWLAVYVDSRSLWIGAMTPGAYGADE